MDGTGKALFEHIGVYMSDGLAQPGELKPNPLFVVIVLYFLSSFVVTFFKILFEVFEEEGTFHFLEVYFELLLSSLLTSFLLVIAIFAFKGKVFILVGAFLDGYKVVFKIFFHFS